MKKCPTCKRTFEDTLTYCLIDGSILDAPFDPQATLIIPEPRRTVPPPTEILPVEETREEIPPTIASPRPEQKPEESVPTIVAPAPVLELPKVEVSFARPSQQTSRLSLIMVGVGVLLVIGLIIFFAVNAGSTRENGAQTNSSPAATNSGQASSTATPSPVPSLTPVSNLEGTVWDVTRVQDDGHSYKHTFEFEPNGKMIDTEDNRVEGVWTQQGNKVSIKHGNKVDINRVIIEGTINGNEMSGYYNFIELKSGKDTFTAHRIK